MHFWTGLTRRRLIGETPTRTRRASIPPSDGRAADGTDWRSSSALPGRSRARRRCGRFGEGDMDGGRLRSSSWSGFRRRSRGGRSCAGLRVRTRQRWNSTSGMPSGWPAPPSPNPTADSRAAASDASDEHPGLRNKGLLATHELLHGVPKRDDWDEATRRAESLLPKRGRDLVEGLGFEVEERGRSRCSSKTRSNPSSRRRASRTRLR